ncbi:cob(I)yrinic acid a,c-diamide adenosyltransferase [Candidatus Woesearchaeota archaeon]|nr:cob(I)yrinic acid a,c-diamide adenosyltransferase [Candidatus Woesearchaeota archaeon]
MIHLYTGNGGGKTTSALGVAMRALGHGKKVVMIQFMKGRKDTGEFKIQKRLKNFKVYQFGRKECIRPLDQPLKIDYELAEKGLAMAEKVLKQKPFLLILDEINLAASIGLLDKEKVLEVLKKKPKQTNIILTGRYALEEFIRLADISTRVEDEKRTDRKAEKGIEY